MWTHLTLEGFAQLVCFSWQRLVRHLAHLCLGVGGCMTNISAKFPWSVWEFMISWGQQNIWTLTTDYVTMLNNCSLWLTVKCLQALPETLQAFKYISFLRFMEEKPDFGETKWLLRMQISTHIVLISSLFWFLRHLGVHVYSPSIIHGKSKWRKPGWLTSFFTHGHAVEKEVKWAWGCTWYNPVHSDSGLWAPNNSLAKTRC